MIASITRILLLTQATFAIAICVLAIKLWSVSNPLVAALLGLGAVLAFRLAITINNFYLAWRFRSPVPDGFNLNGWQAARLFLQEFQATMWASSWGMPFQ